LIDSTILDFKYTSKSHIVEYSHKSEVSIYADRERIAQVLINLISNAIKYSPQAKKIVVNSTIDKNNVKVSIQDFGLGIPTGEQSKIFGRFFRVKGKKEKGISGLGLGLYISQEIVTQHKGKLWVESTEGKGSTFYFSLPIK
jgi:signal transduction histidine kinase